MKEGAEMQNPNKLIATVIGLTVAALCAGALLGGAWWGQMEGQAVPAAFKVGDCYHHTGPIKRWEPRAAGMVFDIDAGTYLVVSYLGMRTKPVDRWVYGHERSIELFDREHVKVDCLEEWK
jgi:hypothetical protein